MKKIFKFVAISFAALSLGSCGIVSPVSNNLTDTRVLLNQSNFKVIGQAEGESSATYIFGIGGMSTKALKNNAINEMSKNANLKGSQTLTNITTQTSIKTILGVYTKVTYTATANVVEFTK